MFRAAGEEGGSEEGGGQHGARRHRGERGRRGVGVGEPGEARSCLLTTYFSPVNRLPSAPAFCFANLSNLWILVPQPGIQPMPAAKEVWSPNHWTAREGPETPFFMSLPF